MFYFVDESGNTGLNLFDANQPKLYYGVLGCRANLDVIAEPLLKELRRDLGVKRLHANELGVGRLTPIAEKIARFSKKNDLRFSLYKVSKPDHAIITFFDQVFDSGLNDAVPWHHYWTPMRYVLLFKVSFLFDEDLAKEAWSARREQNPARCEERLKKLYAGLLERVGRLPDARSRELVAGAIKWAAANPKEISFGSSNYESTLQISPNLIGFQQVLQAIAIQSNAQKSRVNRITVDRQTEFNGAQAELSEWYRRLRGHKSDMGPGMPKADYSHMPETPPVFMPGDESAGLELVDVTLWLTKRLEEKKPISPELRALFWSQAKRGMTDEVSLKALDRRWRHLAHLPEPENPLPGDLVKIFEDVEEKRRKIVSAL
ncbi:DUF3800 domain-containing protein [Mesorhizobium sp. B283B1A]|uniref:DUF3800 domain-containing protein n=1 Tax=Mesorhizobium TaxID=68287 RepID=UPI001CD16746|nr:MULTISPECIES: DUF3800 domain-containing protein [Mesorhizobium]MCA0049364.1 DUF3800 domain-containing protein [Mesorhizobium sp. B283B1A]UQS66497.1 DUF3800 domain-containing protein [Mesorhizobium opportunistum]